jgi:cytochrome b subunit of formate dehydrogenase
MNSNRGRKVLYVVLVVALVLHIVTAFMIRDIPIKSMNWLLWSVAAIALTYALRNVRKGGGR